MFSQIKRILIACTILIVLSGVLDANAATEEELLAVHEGFRDALNAQDVERV